MKVIISETFSCSRKDFETLPENFSIKLEFIKVEVMTFLKVMFYDENDEELFYSTVAVSPELTDVAESIRITPCYNIVLQYCPSLNAGEDYRRFSGIPHFGCRKYCSLRS